MTYLVKYNFGGDWHVYVKTNDYLEAKKAAKAMQKNLKSATGKKYGAVKIFEEN